MGFFIPMPDQKTLGKDMTLKCQECEKIVKNCQDCMGLLRVAGGMLNLFKKRIALLGLRFLTAFGMIGPAILIIGLLCVAKRRTKALPPAKGTLTFRTRSCG